MISTSKISPRFWLTEQRHLLAKIGHTAGTWSPTGTQYRQLTCPDQARCDFKGEVSQPLTEAVRRWLTLFAPERRKVGPGTHSSHEGSPEWTQRLQDVGTSLRSSEAGPITGIGYQYTDGEKIVRLERDVRVCDMKMKEWAAKAVSTKTPRSSAPTRHFSTVTNITKLSPTGSDVNFKRVAIASAPVSTPHARTLTSLWSCVDLAVAGHFSNGGPTFDSAKV